LKALGAEFYHIDRGGDITFHGEGQVVCYPILDLEKLGIGLRRYIEILEQSIIETVAEYGIEGRRLEGATGVWLCDEAEQPNGEKTQRNWRKICAIGVKASRFVTMHGLALNVSTDLKWFTMINPCGFVDKGVTSIEKEIGVSVNIDEVRELLVENLTKLLTNE
jgi:lipoyl(octanoyl) transferase